MQNSSYRLNVSDVVALEHLIEADGIPLHQLMKTAGGSVAELIRKRCNNSEKVVIFAGSGNNGGDGWVVAGLLAEAGYPVHLISPVAAEDIKAEPAHSVASDISLDYCLGFGAGKDISGQRFELSVCPNPDVSQIQSALEGAGCIVDAILGAGFAGNTLREPFASWVEAINAHKQQNTCLVVAVDTPSGLSAQTGETAVTCVIADLTVTMLALKPGLLTPQAASYTGEIHLAELIDLSPYSMWLEEHSLPR